MPSNWRKKTCYFYWVQNSWKFYSCEMRNMHKKRKNVDCSTSIAMFYLCDKLQDLINYKPTTCTNRLIVPKPITISASQCHAIMSLPQKSKSTGAFSFVSSIRSMIPQIVKKLRRHLLNIMRCFKAFLFDDSKIASHWCQFSRQSSENQSFTVFGGHQTNIQMTTKNFTCFRQFIQQKKVLN